MTLTGLQHVLVLSDDIDATRDFYRDVVGLSIGARPPLAFPGYWLYADGVPCVHIAQRDAYVEHARGLGLSIADDAGGPGPIDHLAFAARDYEEVSERLRRGGVRAIANAVPGGPRQLFFDDPNGVRVEINVERRTR